MMASSHRRRARQASGELSVQSIQMLAQLRTGMLHRVDFSRAAGGKAPPSPAPPVQSAPRDT